MKLVVRKRDLFSVDATKYALAHCVSSDYTMRAGIAVEFVRRFDARRLCMWANPRPSVPDCIHIKPADNINIFNLVTKTHHWNKPNYGSLSQSLMIMKQQILELGITKLAMPQIGCGLDRLKWPTVRKYIDEIFSDVEDLEILICIKKE